MLDLYKKVLWSPGQEIRSGDLNDAQDFLESRLFDQIISRASSGDLESRFPIDSSGLRIQSGYCHSLTTHGGQPRVGSANNRIRMSAGTVFVRSVADDGNAARVLAYTFDGTEEVVIDPGDSTNFRRDLLQLRLSVESDDLSARVHANPPRAASRQLSTIAPNVTITVAATLAGRDGNSISVIFEKRTSGTGVTISESGRTVTVRYQDGVSTVLDVVDAISLNATLIVVADFSSGDSILDDPADSFSTTLIDGRDTSLLSDTSYRKKRVVATLSLKKGTAGSNSYPGFVDLGFVPIAVVIVPPNWNGVKAPSYWMEEAYSAAQLLPILHDLRVPIRIREYSVGVHEFITNEETVVWNKQFNLRRSSFTTSGNRPLIAVCPTKIGRLVGITMLAGGGDAGGTATTGGGVVVGSAPYGGAIVAPFFTPGYLVDSVGADVSSLWTATESDPRVKHADQELIGKNGISTPFSNTFSSAFSYPIWCNGGRVGFDAVEPTHYSFRQFQDPGVTISAIPHEHGLCVAFLCADNASVSRVIFHVAEGL